MPYGVINVTYRSTDDKSHLREGWHMYGEKKLMNRQEYLAAVNKYLMNGYLISLLDTGYSDDEWLSRFGDLDAEEAAEIYAAKYDLIKVDEGFY
jgi:hypothetical protein